MVSVIYIKSPAWLQAVRRPGCRSVVQCESTEQAHYLPRIRAVRTTPSTTRPGAARLQARSSSWASGTVERIRPAKLDTLAYTPGRFLWAHPSPKLTTPAWIHVPFPKEQTRGPPESPWEKRRLRVNASSETWGLTCTISIISGTNSVNQMLSFNRSQKNIIKLSLK